MKPPKKFGPAPVAELSRQFMQHHLDAISCMVESQRGCPEPEARRWRERAAEAALQAALYQQAYLAQTANGLVEVVEGYGS